MKQKGGQSTSLLLKYADDLIIQEEFMSRQSEKLRSLSGAGCLPDIDSIGSNTVMCQGYTHEYEHTHTFCLCPSVGIRKG